MWQCLTSGQYSVARSEIAFPKHWSAQALTNGERKLTVGHVTLKMISHSSVTWNQISTPCSLGTIFKKNGNITINQNFSILKWLRLCNIKTSLFTYWFVICLSVHWHNQYNHRPSRTLVDIEMGEKECIDSIYHSQHNFQCFSIFEWLYTKSTIQQLLMRILIEY